MPVSGAVARRCCAVALAAIVAGATPGSARAQSTGTAGTSTSPGASKAACIADFERAEELRAAKKLLDARQHLLECGSLRCPTDVQKECAKELVAVEQSLPSIVLALRGEDGHDIVDAHALVDGAGRALDGQAISLDPGRHTVRFENAGCEPAEQLVLLGEGEKNRSIVGMMRCGGDGAAPAPATARAGATEAGAPSSSRSPSSSSPSPSPSPSRVLPLVLAGVGVVGIAGFAYFGVQGRSAIEDVRATGCAPSCDRDAVMHARTKLLVGDVFGAVGLLSLGAAAWVFFSTPASAPAPARATAPPAVSLDVRPSPSGGAMLVRGRF